MAKKAYTCNVKMFAFEEFTIFESSGNGGVVISRKSQGKFSCPG